MVDKQRHRDHLSYSVYASRKKRNKQLCHLSSLMYIMEEGLEGKQTFNPSASLLGRVTINVEGSQKPPSYHGSHHLGSSAESGEMISLGSSHDKFDDLSAYTAGLSSHEATQRLYRWGPNDATLTSGRNNRRLMLPSRLRGLSLLVGLHRWVSAHLHESMLAKYCEQFKNPLIGLLLVSATISFFLGQIENGLSIFIVRFVKSLEF